MQVKILISDVLRLQCAHQRSGQKRRALGRAFLDHDADDVNGFLVQASVAMQDPLLAPKRGSAWRPRSALRDAADRPRVRRRRAR
jgi:hypothetical protein